MRAQIEMQCVVTGPKGRPARVRAHAALAVG